MTRLYDTALGAKERSLLKAEPPYSPLPAGPWKAFELICLFFLEDFVCYFTSTSNNTNGNATTRLIKADLSLVSLQQPACLYIMPRECKTHKNQALLPPLVNFCSWIATICVQSSLSIARSHTSRHTHTHTHHNSSPWTHTPSLRLPLILLIGVVRSQRVTAEDVNRPPRSQTRRSAHAAEQ